MMKYKSHFLLISCLSFSLLVQSCSFTKKAQCKKVVDTVNQLNTVWYKKVELGDLRNKKPKNLQEANSIITEITQLLRGSITEADPLLNTLESEQVDDKLLAIYRQNILFLQVKRSNLVREGINSIGKFSPSANIPKMPLRVGGSMSDTLLTSEPEDKTPKEPDFEKIARENHVKFGQSVIEEMDPVGTRKRKHAAWMADMEKSIQFLQNMKNTDEELKSEELTIMRRVSAACDMPMPKV